MVATTAPSSSCAAGLWFAHRLAFAGLLADRVTGFFKIETGSLVAFGLQSVSLNMRLNILGEFNISTTLVSSTGTI